MKKLLIIPLLLLSLTICGCSDKNNTTAASDSSPVESISVSSSDETSKSSDTTSSTSSSKTSVSVSEPETEETVETDPVENEEIPDIQPSEEFLPIYEEIGGSYQDEYSQRACAELESYGCGVKITVIWSYSAFGHEEWEMNATYQDGKLYYSDCCHMDVDDTNPESPKYEVLELDAKGYFEVKEGKLYWTGASDEDCKNCIFSKPASKPAE